MTMMTTNKLVPGDMLTGANVHKHIFGRRGRDGMLSCPLLSVSSYDILFVVAVEFRKDFAEPNMTVIAPNNVVGWTWLLKFPF